MGLFGLRLRTEKQTGIGQVYFDNSPEINAPWRLHRISCQTSQYD